jgi:hypothetical protein
MDSTTISLLVDSKSEKFHFTGHALKKFQMMIGFASASINMTLMVLGEILLDKSDIMVSEHHVAN